MHKSCEWKVLKFQVKQKLKKFYHKQHARNNIQLIGNVYVHQK